MCDTWFQTWQDLLQEIRTDEDEKQGHRLVLQKKINSFLNATKSLTPPACSIETEWMLPSPNSNIKEVMESEILHPHKGLCVYRPAVAFWKTVVVRSHEGPLWEGGSCDTMIVSSSWDEQGCELVSLRIGTFGDSFEHSKLLQYVFVPDTSVIPVYLWTSDRLNMKIWYEQDRVCKMDFLHYQTPKEMIQAFGDKLSDDWWHTCFQDDAFLLFLYNHPEWYKEVAEIFEMLRHLTYAFTLDCWHGYGFNRLTMEDVHKHQKQLVESNSKNRSMLLSFYPRMRGEELSDDRTLFSDSYDVVLYNVKEQEMLQMNSDEVYYAPFPWIRNKRKACDQLDQPIKQQRIS